MPDLASSLNCSHICNTVFHSLLSGENDLVGSFQALCSGRYQKDFQPIVHLFETNSSGLDNGRLSAWAYLAYYLAGRRALSDKNLYGLDFECFQSESIKAGNKFSIIPFGDIKCAPLELWTLLVGHFQEGGDFVQGVESPNHETIEHANILIIKARKIIKFLDPDLHRLMNLLQHLIILAQPIEDARRKGENFGGATCFFFRGGTIINASLNDDIASMTERLVHEYAHAELFVISQDQKLCLNNDDERYSVTIRRDPRPMNGILHSLYVVARVAEYTAKVLSADFKDEIASLIHRSDFQKVLRNQLRHGQASLSVIKRDGKLTPLGEDVVSACEQRLISADACKGSW